MVYVQNRDGAPLMPCANVIARLLLKDQRAKVIHIVPFTIQLLYTPQTIKTQPLTLGIDTGSGTIGSAVVDSKNKVLYRSEIEVRNDITSKMEQRSKYRRTRRTRKCRYRACRFLNRKNSIRQGRLAPTLRSKIDAHLREIHFVQSILPIVNIIIEGGSFDPHALKNPEVLTNPLLYQRGLNYGFYNTKTYILYRDGHICQHCKGTSKDTRLHVHHIIFKRDGGSDTQENLITLCETCHDQVHHGDIVLRKRGIKKLQLHATQMNVIISQLLQCVKCEETFGFITKAHREALAMEKSHSTDAIVIASRGNPIDLNGSRLLVKKCVAKGDYQQTKGICSDQPIPTGKIHGFRKFDKVCYRNSIYFIKGRMSTGYAILMDIHGTKQDLKPIPKFSKMERIGVRKTWIMTNI